jgi:hypothetical protein
MGPILSALLFYLSFFTFKSHINSQIIIINISIFQIRKLAHRIVNAFLIATGSTQTKFEFLQKQWK